MSDAATEQGRDRARVDAPLKVAGLAPYAYEHEVGEALFLAPVLSTIAAGEITGIDTEAARAVRGVRLVLTHDNAPRLALPTLPTLTVLRKPRVRYRGEIVAAVVADSLETARYAASLVQVDYAPGEPDVRVDEHGRDVRSLRRVMGIYPGQHTVGDVDAALAGAAYRVAGDYATPTNHHNPIEPHSVVALWHEEHDRWARLQPRTTRLTVWDSNQGVVAPQGVLAGASGCCRPRSRWSRPTSAARSARRVCPTPTSWSRSWRRGCCPGRRSSSR
nr:molybdopterin cofactor-binding domain-containing protein [Serinicoccus sp. CUA-874]